MGPSSCGCVRTTALSSYLRFYETGANLREEKETGVLLMGKRKLRRVVVPPGAEPESHEMPAIARLGVIGKASAVSRGKRKRSEKRARVESKHEFIDAELKRLEAEAAARRAAIVAKKRGAENGPALAFMETLRDNLELEEGAADAQAGASKGLPVQKIVHEKQRRKILADETVQVKGVIEHPSYQANPMEALRQHLMNGLDEDPLAVPAPLVTGDGGKKRKQELKATSQPLRRAVSSRKTSRPAEASARRREAKSEMAAKARRNRLGVSKGHSVSRGRIGEKRPKI